MRHRDPSSRLLLLLLLPVTAGLLYWWPDSRMGGLVEEAEARLGTDVPTPVAPPKRGTSGARPPAEPTFDRRPPRPQPQRRGPTPIAIVTAEALPTEPSPTAAVPSPTPTLVPSPRPAPLSVSVPAGYTVTAWTRLPPAPTSLAFDPQGHLLVAFFAGRILRVGPDGAASLYAEDLEWPLGLALRGDEVYVSTRRAVLALRDSDGDGLAETRRVVAGDLPCCHILHSTNGLAFGPDGALYAAQGGMSDHGEVEATAWENAILRLNPDGSGLEVFAHGLRNPYDLAFDSQGNLFAGDAGADFGPPDEINHIVRGGDYGFPRYHGAPPPDSGTLAPVVELPPHTTPTGLAFAPAGWGPFAGHLLVALWQITEGGNRVVAVELLLGGESFQGVVRDFMTGPGWQPIDLAFGPEGALYVAAFDGTIYKVAPQPAR